MEKISTEILKTITDAAAAHPVLASAAASGLLGGGLSMGSPQRRGETPGGRRLRILRNALLAAGAGGGAVALGQAAMQNLNTAVPAGDVDPVERKFTSPWGRAALGAGGVVSAHNWLGRKDDVAAFQKELGSELATSGKARAQGLSDDFVRELGGVKSKGVTRAMMHGAAGPKLHKAIEDTLYADGKGPGKIENILKGLNLGAADRELYHAGLPLPAQMGDVKGLAGVGRKAGRPIARTLANLFSPTSAQLSGSASKLLSPLARTGIGASAVFLPEAFRALTGAAKDYALEPQ